jgi:hypothetical protein
MKRSARMLSGMGFLFVALAYLPSGLTAAGTDVSAKCVECHPGVTPNVVNDWRLSERAGSGIGCDSCHGVEHLAAEDVAFQEGQARVGVGGNGSDSDHSLPTNGEDRRNEGLRRVPQDWAEVAGTSCGLGEIRRSLRECVVQFLPYTAHVLSRRGEVAARSEMARLRR